jgi:hypothetical protein
VTASNYAVGVQWGCSSKLTETTEEVVLLESKSAQDRRAHGLDVAHSDLLARIDGAKRTSNNMAFLNEQNCVRVAGMVDGACHEVNNLSIGLMCVGEAKIHRIGLNL